MLKPRSALEGITKFEAPGLSLTEAPKFILTQISGEEKTLKRAIGKLPAMGKATENILRVGPNQFWTLGKVPEARGVFLTPLSSSRTRILVEGEKAAALLQSSVAIDFAALEKEDYVMTGMHHVPVLIHCVGKNKFHIYVMRTFALSIWDWLVEAAAGLNDA
jgi:methylglutamate dehydrogenase subunit D